MKNIRKKETKYVGTEMKYLQGRKIRIVGVMKNALLDIDKDNDPRYDYITDSDVLENMEVTKFDRVEVQTWSEKFGRWTMVTSDPKAVDLDCFKSLQ